MALLDTYTRLQLVLRTALGIPVIADYPDAERPLGPYAILSLTSETADSNLIAEETIPNPEYSGEAAIPYVYPYLKRTWCGVNRVWSLNIYATDSLNYASRARQAVQSASYFTTMEPYRVNAVGTANRVPAFVGNLWEDRTNIDITVSGYEPFDVPLTTVEHVDVEWHPNFRTTDPTWPPFTLHVDRPGSHMAASLPAVFGLEANLRAAQSLSAELSAGTDLTAVLRQGYALRSVLQATTGLSGAIQLGQELRANIAAATGLRAGLRLALALQADLPATTSLDANLGAGHALRARLRVDTALTGRLRRGLRLEADMLAATDLEAILREARHLKAAMAATTGFSARLTRTRRLHAALAAATAMAPTLSVVQTYDPDARAYWQRGATTPTDAEKKKLSDFVKTLKASGAWAKLDIIQLYAAPYSDIRPLNLKGLNYTAIPVNAVAEAPGVGYTTDAVSAYIRTGLVGSTAQFVQDSACWGMKIMQAPGVGLAASGVVGLAGTGPSTYLAWNTANNAKPRVNSTTDATVMGLPNNATRTGLMIFNRTSSSNFDIYVDGTLATSVSSPSAPPVNSEVLIGRHNTAYNVIGAALFFAGGTLTAAQCASISKAMDAYLA